MEPPNNTSSLLSSGNNLKSSKPITLATGYSYPIAPNPRFYRTKRASESGTDTDGNEGDGCRISSVSRRQAQATLLDYLHSTRSLQFADAEAMSRNSPRFLDNLLRRVENEESNSRRSLSRFLRYHPINEFEPFFESMGLESTEYASLLPRNLMFLADDEILLENYHILCDYGVPRNKIGRIYIEAPEVFRYDFGVLKSRLQAFEDKGLDRLMLGKFIASGPCLLSGNQNGDFLKVLEKLASDGIEYGWIEKHLPEGNSCNWSHVLEVLSVFSKIGFGKEPLGGLLCQHPGLLFDNSGTTTMSLIGFLLKYGANVKEINSMFTLLPQTQIDKYVLNLRHCCHVLNELEMDFQEIARIVRSHPVLLGSCSLKKVSSLLNGMNTGKKRLCEIIKKNPQELKNWVLGSRVKPLPREFEELLQKKTAFLLELGFVEGSREMRKALKVFRGSGAELQERFDCLVSAGLNRKEVSKMVEKAPQILNLSKNMIEKKIDFIVNGLGYPVSSLVAFPAFISYTIQRINLRCSMYNWLKEQGTVDSKLAFSTFIGYTDKIFMRKFVNKHPRGLEVWEKLKKQIILVEKI